MKGILGVLRKELFEVFRSVRGIALALVLPIVFVILVGSLHTQTVSFRLLVAGLPSSIRQSSSPALDPIRQALAVLRETSSLQVIEETQRVVDPLAELRTRNIDVLVDAACSPTECPPVSSWRLYTAETDPTRVAALSSLIDRLTRIIVSSNASAPRNTANDLDRLAQQIAEPQTSLYLLHRLVADPNLYLLPMAITLIICFLPFALAVSSVIREREARTWEIQLTAPYITMPRLLAGKCLTPVAVAMVQFLLLIVCAQSIYGLEVKPGVLEVVLFLLPALLGSTLAGLSVSALANSQTQAMVAAALYFLALALLTGFLLPLGEASTLVRTMSKFFPLTFVLPVVRAWMFGADPLPQIVRSSGWLLQQCFLFGVTAVWGFRRTLDDT